MGRSRTGNTPSMRLCCEVPRRAGLTWRVKRERDCGVQETTMEQVPKA